MDFVMTEETKFGPFKKEKTKRMSMTFNKQTRIGGYVVVAGVVLVASIAGGFLIWRKMRSKSKKREKEKSSVTCTEKEEDSEQSVSNERKDVSCDSTTEEDDDDELNHNKTELFKKKVIVRK